MEANSLLDKIKDFADQSHGEQLRKYTPERYIVHPVRVMQLCREYTQDISQLAAALLHDVLEDTPVSREQMREFLLTLMDKEQAEKTLKLVVELTDVYVKADYPQWNRRTRKAKEMERIEKTSPESQTIKYADIIDNCSEIIRHDPSFAAVFLRECKEILRKTRRGNPLLYERAVNTINTSLQQLHKR